jgi:CBS domain containing-hemolysin-like protein
MESFLQAVPALISVLFLVLLNAYFVASEFALVRAMATKLRAPELKGKFGTATSLKLIENLDESISITQLGITVASLVLGWYGEEQLHHMFAALFTWLNLEPNPVATHALATTLALIVVTFLHVVLGELVAKSIAIRYPEITLRIIAAPLYLLSKSCKPLVFLMNGSANIVLRIMGMKTELEGERVHSSGELSLLIAHSMNRGVIDKDEEEMLQGVFDFSETVAREVMTPRTDLITIQVGASFKETIQIISQSGYSRFPVIDGTVDKVVGILLSRDLLPVVDKYCGANPKPFQIREIMRNPYFIPGTKSIMELLKEFKTRKLHQAIVLDEHGGVDGAVTLEDLIEEIVGDIYDESDAIESDITIDETSGDLIVDAGLLVDDVNEQFELSIPEGEYDTIAGFFMSSLGRVPEVGDQILITQGGLALVHEPTKDDPTSKSEQDGTNQLSSGSADDSSSENVDGANQESSTSSIDKPQAVLTVEKVSGNRIETIRIKQPSEPHHPSSQAANE